MSSLVEAIARQAQLTFSRNLGEENITENLSKLIKSVSKVRASDLKVKDSLRTIGNESKRKAPVTYIEVAENKTFSMGIFLLRSGARIPLHDHPGMHGVLKVIQGTVKITSFSALSNVPSDIKIPQDVISQLKTGQIDHLLPVEKHTSGNVTEKDEPCVLKPKEGNFHEICAIGGPAAFLDILAPPYDLKERDCHYYISAETKKADSEVKYWLTRTAPPEDFWCDSAPYTGPSPNVNL
ncbi:2-aminoethanethiol dioxygenase [Trichonephila inaurata madagascariensis]|uniref:2-aminoethanethiol dioxygenase n=1 Tax=Trichonephila inaurata madagascariensis TaxID=2747483 RepID=A0A8X6WSX8_9ARAC|nr:2-aminoethanethiol dioxygenase [Trichonephila inaurata madagascariensis]